MHYKVKEEQKDIVAKLINQYYKDIDGINGEDFKVTKRTFFKSLIPLLDKIVEPEFKVLYSACGIKKEIPNSCYVGPNVLIERGVVLGENIIFEGNNYIHSGTTIGDNVLIQANTVIGGEGYSHEYIEDELIHLPHIGGVIIEANVTIGSCVCIDKGLLAYTILKEGCRIDNLVHIAHDVYIGRNAFIVACSMLGGRAVLEGGCWIAPNSSIKNGIKIGHNALVGMHSCVLKNVGNGKVVYGVPAKEKDA